MGSYEAVGKSWNKEKEEERERKGDKGCEETKTEHVSLW